MPVSSLPIASPARPTLPQLASSYFDHPTACASPSNPPSAPAVGIPSPVAQAQRKVVAPTAGNLKRKTRLRMSRIEEEKWRAERVSLAQLPLHLPPGGSLPPQTREEKKDVMWCRFATQHASNMRFQTCQKLAGAWESTR